MDKQRLDKIEEKMEYRREEADKIMDGADLYDGADGARYIRDLCKDFKEVIQYLREIAF